MDHFFHEFMQQGCLKKKIYSIVKSGRIAGFHCGCCMGWFDFCSCHRKGYLWIFSGFHQSIFWGEFHQHYLQALSPSISSLRGFPETSQSRSFCPVGSFLLANKEFSVFQVNYWTQLAANQRIVVGPANRELPQVFFFGPSRSSTFF